MFSLSVVDKENVWQLKEYAQRYVNYTIPEDECQTKPGLYQKQKQTRRCCSETKERKGAKKTSAEAGTRQTRSKRSLGQKGEVLRGHEGTVNYMLSDVIQKRQSENVPRTLDNSREFDPSILPTDPTTTSTEQQEELAADLDSDPYASYFTATEDPTIPPKVLITTSHKASRLTYDFCDEIVGVFPGAEFIRRKKGKGFEIGWIAAWAGTRGYKHLIVVNEDMRRPSAVFFFPRWSRGSHYRKH